MSFAHAQPPSLLGKSESAAPRGLRPGCERDRAIEGLRGLAALAVFYNHLFAEGEVGGWAPSNLWTWAVSGPAAVMVFFVLSGYVIGLSYPPQPGGATGSAVRRYAWRRVVRLGPINGAAVLLACAVADALDVSTVLGNLFFLQNFADYSGAWVLVLRENMNLWSLNYEVVFYAVFAALWWGRVSLGLTLAAAVAFGVLGWIGWGVPLFLACYAFGFLFWLAGLWLAWRAVPAPASGGNWPSCLLLAIITWKLQGVAEILIPLDATLPRFAGPVVKLYHLDFLPVCVWLVATVARRSFRGLGVVQGLAALIPLVGLGVRWTRAEDFWTGENVAIVTVYLAGLALWRWRPTLRCFERCAALGLVSYALYATARPIQTGIFRLGRELPGNALSFGLCAATTVIVAFGVAWYLERRLQPAISAAWTPRVPRGPEQSGGARSP